MRVFIILLILFSIQATVVLAAGGGNTGNSAHGDFTPITPLPSTEGATLATDRDIPFYINTLFQYALIAGAGLAAIFIAIGGFEYIISESTESKRDGRMRITHALYGLAILLLVTIILFIINPDAICLEIFKNNGSCSGLSR